MEARFGRVITAMITPFAANGSLDLDGAVELARWLVEQGNDGLVLAGTTGESPTLTHDEQIAMVEAVAGGRSGTSTGCSSLVACRGAFVSARRCSSGRTSTARRLGPGSACPARTCRRRTGS